MKLPAILKEENVEAAAELLRRYYLEPSTTTGLLSTGSYFDEWANRGDGPDARDRITDSDAVAVSMLSVKVPAQAIIGLQEKPLAAKIRDLLAKIPTDVKMSDLTVAEAEATLGESSPAWLLWNELRRTPKNRWDVGATTASKILARKRPHLIPIWDKVIGTVVGKRTAKDHWLNWHNFFMEDPDLAGRLARIHQISTVQTTAMSQCLGNGRLHTQAKWTLKQQNHFLSRAPFGVQRRPRLESSVGESIAEPDEVLVHCGPSLEQGLNGCAVM